VRDALSLDAFTRCWVQEGVLLERVAGLLDGTQRTVMADLARAWERGNVAIFERACQSIGRYLCCAASDHEPLDGERVGQSDKRRGMRILAERLDDATRRLMDALIADHGLVGRYETDARERLREDFDLPGETAWTSARTTIVGAAMGGAAGGLMADVMVAGLSFGGGAVAGAILGAAGAMSLRKGYQIVRGDEAQRVRWALEFLDQLLRQSLLRYLAVAHFGRGRGEWRDTGNPERWSALVESALAPREGRFAAAVTGLRGDATESAAVIEKRLTDLVREALSQVLAAAYPQAAHIVRAASRSDDRSAP
jgi:hypothetical protein